MTNQDPEVRGSEVMYPVAASNGEAAQALVPASPFTSPMASPQFGGFAPQGPEILTGSFNQTWLINCLRRKWLMSVLLGLLFACVAAVALLFLFPVSSSITAYLQVKAADPNTVFNKKQGNVSRQEFEIFLETQKALLKSQFVLSAALMRPDIAQLNAVVKEGGRDDALMWLTDGLDVEVAGKGEILMLQYKGEESSAEMVKVVNAVIEAYQTEVLNVEKTQADAERLKLRDLEKQTSDDLQQKIAESERLIQELGEGESPMAAQMTAMLMREASNLESEITRANDLLVEIEVERELAERDSKSTTAIQQAIDAQLQADVQLAQYEQRLFEIEQGIAAAQSLSKGSNSPRIKKMRQQYQQTKQQAEQYRFAQTMKIREQLKSTPDEIYRQAMAAYKIRREHAREIGR